MENCTFEASSIYGFSFVKLYLVNPLYTVTRLNQILAYTYLFFNISSNMQLYDGITVKIWSVDLVVSLRPSLSSEQKEGAVHCRAILYSLLVYLHTLDPCMCVCVCVCVCKKTHRIVSLSICVMVSEPKWTQFHLISCEE